MARGITSGAQRLMEQFLNSVEGKSALYDEEMKLIWTNFNDFFNEFDMEKTVKENSVKTENSFSVNIDGSNSVLNITPVYKSLRTIAAYVCIIKNPYEVYKLMNKTSISDFTNNMLEKNTDRLERLAELNAQIGEAVHGGEALEYIDDLILEQKRLLVSMRNETKYYKDTCYNEVDVCEVNCNLSQMFGSLCSDAEESFKDLGRKVIFDGEARDYYIIENSRALVIAFLHLLRSHLILSPLKSNLNITTFYEENGYNTGNFCISVKTKLNPIEKTDESVVTTSTAYRELAKKVILFDYNGTFDCSNDGKSMQTVFKFPALKKNRGPMLTTSNSWYLNENNRMLHTYMMDIIEQEIGDLERAKMENSKKKKLARHE